MKKIRDFITLFFKGIGMGAANVIPGVSGGTVALITGIFEELINSIKSFDITAIKLLATGKFKQFTEYVNLRFLIYVFSGIVLSIISLAKLLEFLFTNYPVYVWAYFFGLILASVYFVGKTIHKWSFSTIVTFITGATLAVLISVLNPATENEGFFYLILCGIVAICSMILPGLSGSFVLILMGNYELIVIKAVTDIRLDILFPVFIGAVAGLIAFSHFLSWIYKKYKDQTIGLLTGFILGSLSILWPWKKSFDAAGNLLPVNDVGAFLDSTGNIIQEEIKIFVQNQIMPDSFSSVVLMASALMILGILSIWFIEKLAEKNHKT